MSVILFIDTTIHEIEESFNSFVARSDIAIILITQKVTCSYISFIFTLCSTYMYKEQFL